MELFPVQPSLNYKAWSKKYFFKQFSSISSSARMNYFLGYVRSIQYIYFRTFNFLQGSKFARTCNRGWRSIALDLLNFGFTLKTASWPSKLFGSWENCFVIFSFNLHNTDWKAGEKKFSSRVSFEMQFFKKKSGLYARLVRKSIIT